MGLSRVRPLRIALVTAGLSAGGCVHAPEAAMRAYGQALEAGRLDEAWALSAPLDREHFVERYGDAAARHQRAEQALKAAEGQPAEGFAIEARADGWRVLEAPVPEVPRDDEAQARALVDHFLAAVQSGDFDAVFGDLAASWRARYTPERLKADLAAEPAAADRLQRIRAARDSKWELTPSGPQLPLGEGKRLKLQREGAALKVVALE